jgi:hypothetical protein
MSVKNALDSFAYDVIDGAKKNLKSKGKNASGKLSKSLDYKLKVSKNSFELAIYAEDYSKFIDQGVKGVGGTKADGSKWKKKRVSGKSPFKYKSKKPPASAFSDWSVRKGIAPRNEKGQFMSRKGLMFAIANSVYHTGLETTNFFTQPFNKEFKELPQEVIKAYDLEVDEFLKFVTK